MRDIPLRHQTKRNSLHITKENPAQVIYMGLTWVEAVIKNPNTGRHTTAKALVDTGATLTVLPRKIAEELQLPVIGRRRVATAKGTAELDECVGVVEVMGRKAYVHMLVSNDVDIVLIGATTLETLGLEVDPVTEKLKETTTYLL
jgi:Predicted aspartyl protease